MVPRGVSESASNGRFGRRRADVSLQVAIRLYNPLENKAETRGKQPTPNPQRNALSPYGPVKFARTLFSSSRLC
ncbi:hypothetical protein PAPYR_8602 [Paratrimastix pyriformis]|uniref:Uncharacterized protein n=1 Tax=Paratrimastix pyriformis TaxID=342808 RepID=A0ABQ8UAA3_9EUKA|nr:hypothetical protein PAPYR_8602 [Paratrimastix pyriformis]